MIKDYYRFANFLIFLLGSLVLTAIILYYHDTFFYLVEKNDFNNWPRLVYTFDFVLLGCSFAIFDSSKGHIPEKKPYSVFATYLTRYLITTIVLATIIFVIFNAIDATSNYLYYFVTLAVGIGVGYVIDFAVFIHYTLDRYLGKK